jgi:tetrahedral aminopeptidase
LTARELLKALSEEVGVSGYETRVAGIARAAFEPYCDELHEDKLGSVIGKRKGDGKEPRPKVLLAGHIDEVGLMVTKIHERGFVSFTTLSVDKRTVPSAEVIIHGSRDVPGIVDVKPMHVIPPEELQMSYKVEDLVIDTGLSFEELSSVVSVGDPIVMAREFTPLVGEFVAGKALDDRIAVVVIAECLKILSKMRHEADVLAVATVQEELGLRGAGVVAYGQEPDIAIAIDVGFGDQTGVPEDKQIALNKGPALAIGPNIHPKVLEALKKAAESQGIDVQLEVSPGRSGTDAWSMQVARAGVPTAILSIPNRYMHTSVETSNMNDVAKAARLLAHFIASVDRAFVEGLVWC